MTNPPSNKGLKIAVIIMAIILVIGFAFTAFGFIQFQKFKSQIKDRSPIKLVMRSHKKFNKQGNPTNYKVRILENEPGYLEFSETLDSKWFGETAADYLWENRTDEKIKMNLRYPVIGLFLDGINGLETDSKNKDYWMYESNVAGMKSLNDTFLVDFILIDFTYERYTPS
ncbi:DUF4430 domain-containing protein [Williamsoniiplasma lucivorax]|uniref:Transcobalamin-like C-terminal domain-containing protein n=1 Tax=Williamsoniiplasma lucivorax TaxID=209274 RepID=A0A2S5R9Z8_9MOLU|nr:DUF4430 domain-containing protein [Williamsoniiplasma lucivorax]PPE04154.1 hypothetical protein ELUCI_v1c09340 [Williamsoniiplasma lucivorax]